MTYYADLTPYTYDRDNGDPEASGCWRGVPLLNVGWLSRGNTYAKGAPPSGLVDALQRMTQTHRAQQTRGYHFCPWCVSRLLGPRGDSPWGSSEIRVMGNGVAYAAPELVAHYVEAHSYLPPAGFVHAVACRLSPSPDPGTHGRGRTRVRGSANEARPYMALLGVFTRCTCPSTTPELHGRVRPAVTASRSWRRTPRSPASASGRPARSAGSTPAAGIHADDGPDRRRPGPSRRPG
ncbi:DUF7919 family protein [Streptomyces hirsutus]